MTKFNLWEKPFRDTVEGRPSPASCRMHDGRPIFRREAIPKNAAPNIRLLVEFLRGETPIPHELRQWLADMFDDEAPSALKLKIQRKKRKPPNWSLSRDWDAAEYALRRIAEESEKKKTKKKFICRKEVLFETETKFGLKRSSIEAVLRSYKEALAEDDRISLAERSN